MMTYTTFGPLLRATYNDYVTHFHGPPRSLASFNFFFMIHLAVARREGFEPSELLLEGSYSFEDYSRAIPGLATRVFYFRFWPPISKQRE